MSLFHLAELKWSSEDACLYYYLFWFSQPTIKLIMQNILLLEKCSVNRNRHLHPIPRGSYFHRIFCTYWKSSSSLSIFTGTYNYKQPCHSHSYMELQSNYYVSTYLALVYVQKGRLHLFIRMNHLLFSQLIFHFSFSFNQETADSHVKSGIRFSTSPGLHHHLQQRNHQLLVCKYVHYWKNKRLQM